MSRRLAHVLALLLPPLAAILVYLPALGGGFLSDDFLFNYLLRHDQPGVVVAWREVLADFARPWLGNEGGVLYRPVMSMSYAIDLWLGGGAAWTFHLTNVLAHAVSALCCALLCGWLWPARPHRAALAGGLLFALHPVGVEATAWISGRVSGLETMWSLLCLVLFVHFRRSGRRAAWLGSALLALLALWTKESAVVLPISLVVIDLLHHTASGGSTRLRRLAVAHLGLLPIWGLYVLLRYHALGTLTGRVMGEVRVTPLAGFVQGLPGKVAALVTGGTGPPLLAAVLLAALAALVAGQALASRRRLAPSLLTAWILVHLVPSYQIAVDGLAGSRVVYGALPALALLAGGLVTPTPAPRGARLTRVGSVVVAIALLACAFAAVRRLGEYQGRWNEVAAIRASLARRAVDATPARPIAVLATPSQTAGIPVLNPNAVFPLLEIPYATANHPLIGLNFLLVEIADVRELFLDASPLRAIRETGALPLAWLGEDFTEQGGSRAAPGVVEVTADGELLTSSFDPFRLEALELIVAGSTTGGTLRWPGTAAGIPFRAASSDAASGRILIDLTHSIPLLADAFAAGIRSMTVEWIGGKPRILEARAWERLPRLELPQRLADATVTLGRESETVQAPTTVGADLRLVLLGPHAGYAQSALAGERIHFAPDIARDLRRICRVYRQKRFWYYFEARGAAPARSELDWFRLEIPGQDSSR